MAKAKTHKTTEEPPKSRRRPSGRNGNLLPEHPPKPFNKENQPTSEQKRLGWMKKKRGQELAKAILDLQFKGMKDSELKKQAATYYGIAEKDVTVEMMLLFRQAEKAIQKADTQAFNAVMDRAFGKPKEKVDVNNTGKVTLIIKRANRADS